MYVWHFRFPVSLFSAIRAGKWTPTLWKSFFPTLCFTFPCYTREKVNRQFLCICSFSGCFFDCGGVRMSTFPRHTRGKVLRTYRIMFFLIYLFLIINVDRCALFDGIRIVIIMQRHICTFRRYAHDKVICQVHSDMILCRLCLLDISLLPGIRMEKWTL